MDISSIDVFAYVLDFIHIDMLTFKSMLVNMCINSSHRHIIHSLHSYILFQADAIVVPLDSDLDLSRNRVTSSLSYHGGSRVEKTLRGDGWLGDSTGNRMEVFEMEGILVGSGGNLKAKHIFYLNLPSWGPGASKVRSNVT